MFLIKVTKFLAKEKEKKLKNGRIYFGSQFKGTESIIEGNMDAESPWSTLPMRTNELLSWLSPFLF